MYGFYIADIRTHESTLHSMDIYEIGIPWLPEILAIFMRTIMTLVCLEPRSIAVYIK